MPNLVNNMLYITAPDAQIDALLSALRGPKDWIIPRRGQTPIPKETAKISSHLELKIHETLAAPAAIIAEFKAFMTPYGWPASLKPSRLDLVRFLVDRSRCEPEMVGFSVAKLNPWTDEEVQRFLPSARPEAPFWEPSSRLIASRMEDLRREKIGVKWAPSDITVDVCGVEDGVSQLLVEFTTPWGTIEDISGLMGDVLSRHSARLLHYWVEEQGFCGFTSFDPARPEGLLAKEFGTDNPWMVPFQDPDSPEQSLKQFSYSAFTAFVFEQSNDALFSQAS